MLTEGQKNYLSKLDPERASMPVSIKPFDPHTQIVAEKVIKKIKKQISEADIRFMGASALGISGQNDVDIYIICPADLREVYLTKLSEIFGNQLNWFH
mgnify:CR=1 FL=1